MTASPRLGPNMRNALYEWGHAIKTAERRRPDPIYGETITHPGEEAAREKWRAPRFLRNIPGGMRAAALARLAETGLMERRRDGAHRWEYRMTTAGWAWIDANP